VYAYVFDWKTPVLGGRLRSPHTLEVPFIFGTTDAAAALVGTGPDVATMTRATMGAWVAFARSKIFDSFPYYDFAMPRNFIRG
jgi:para-nitrobenzyl esterase